MERIEDIVREMRIGDIRATANTSSAVERKAFEYINDFLAGYADRIEQAITNCNQLKTREAVAETEKRIDKVVSMLTEIPDSCGYGGLLEDAADELCDLKEEFVKPALSEPPRNCDIMSLENARKVWFAKEIVPRLNGDLPLGKEVPFEEWFVSQQEKGEAQ